MRFDQGETSGCRLLSLSLESVESFLLPARPSLMIICKDVVLINRSTRQEVQTISGQLYR
jgi:hypothetical protein